MDVTPGFKQTEIGIIPEAWEVKPIKDIAAVKGGKRLPLGSSVVDRVTPYPYLRVTDMRPGGVVVNDIKYVPEDAFPVISPDGHFKFPHLWPLKLPQAGRSDYGFPDPV